ncbi:glycosyltransferase [Paenibacillus sp. F411]|uniref:glycosyltransferase n=1 Tax=Paenibacillus sp. F411 TaxID=2820239 RepID=UPI001AAE7C8F|nr:glycosyltransferase [Paenibacillus sp. F411]
METFLQILLIILMVQFLYVLWNGWGWFTSGLSSVSRRDASAAPAALISVLIPARNEERNIDDALRSVLASDYPHLEVLVLDDRSEDGTAEAVRRISGMDSRVKLLEGKEMPDGWSGKVHACHQLSEAAAGEWWLFMDADARLKPGALTWAMQVAERQGRGMITGFPFQVVGTWMEKLIVPLMTFTILCHLPIRWIKRTSHPLLAAAHGAFILVERDSYQRVGGHLGIRNELVDDMALVRSFKRGKEPVQLADIHRHVTMRMYHTSAEVWSGYRKNIFEGLGRSIPLLTAMSLFYFILYVFPVLMLAYSLILAGTDLGSSELMIWSACCVLTGMTVKMAADVNQGQPAWLSIFQPISMLLVILLALDSCRTAYTSRGYQWKGRYYS